MEERESLNFVFAKYKFTFTRAKNDNMATEVGYISKRLERCLLLSSATNLPPIEICLSSATPLYKKKRKRAELDNEPPKNPPAALVGLSPCKPSTRSSYGKYSQEQMDEALEAVINGGSIREVSRTCQVPESTLRGRLNKLGVLNGMRPDEELLLEQWAFAQQRRLSREEIEQKVLEYILAHPDCEQSKEEIRARTLTDTWWRRLLNRREMIRTAIQDRPQEEATNV